jgi:hypothetical protein
VFKTSYERFERELGRKCEQQIWHDFQERLGTNPKENLWLRLAEVYSHVRGHTIHIHTIRTTRKKGTNIEAHIGTFFEAN